MIRWRGSYTDRMLKRLETWRDRIAAIDLDTLVKISLTASSATLALFGVMALIGLALSGLALVLDTVRWLLGLVG